MRFKKMAFVTSLWCILASSLFAAASTGGKVYISKDAIELTDGGDVH